MMAPPEEECRLKRYLEIQQEEQRLKEEKAVLQQQLAAFLEAHQLNVWFPTVADQKLKVRCQALPVVEYDTALLRQRLGERYASLLAPDLKKIREHLADIESCLMPVLELVGSPVPAKVKAALEAGTVRREEFAGAFRKSTKRIISVARLRPEDFRSGSGPTAEAENQEPA